MFANANTSPAERDSRLQNRNCHYLRASNLDLFTLWCYLPILSILGVCYKSYSEVLGGKSDDSFGRTTLWCLDCCDCWEAAITWNIARVTKCKPVIDRNAALQTVTPDLLCVENLMNTSSSKKTLHTMYPVLHSNKIQIFIVIMLKSTILSY